MNLLSGYSLSNRVHAYHGEDSIKQLDAILSELGAARPFLIISRGADATGVLELLGPRWSTKETGNSHDQVVLSSREINGKTAETLAKRFHGQKCDSMIAVGGGTVMDLAKTVSLLATDSDLTLAGAEGLAIRDRTRRLPLVLIPTTIGSGSGATRIAYIRDVVKERAFRLDDERLRADVAILDPKMSKAASSQQTAMGVASILGRALESLTSMAAIPDSDSYARQALRLVIAHAYRVVHTPHDLDARGHIAVASHLAGTAASIAGGSIAHALSITISQLTDIPYGLAMRILLPHTVLYEEAETSTMLDALLPVIDLFSPSGPPSGETVEDQTHPMILWVSRFFQGLTAGMNPPLAYRFHDILDAKGQTRLLPVDRLEAIARATEGSYDMLTSRSRPPVRDLVRILEASYWGYQLDTKDPWTGRFTRKG